MNTVFIEKSYVIGSILNCKRKYLNENFVTFSEATFISYKLQEKFNASEFKVIINDNVDRYWYDVTNVIQTNRNNNIILDSIKEMSLMRFRVNEIKIWEMLWDENIILEILIEWKKQQLEMLQTEYTNNSTIINKEKTKSIGTRPKARPRNQ